jgi:hypothetical protein
MRSVPVFALLAASVAGATMIYYMDLEQALDLSGSVLIGLIISTSEYSDQYGCSVEYTMDVLDMLRGDADTDGPVKVVYTEDYPGSFEDIDGFEVWESPICTGSGMEFGFAAGDTVIAFTAPEYVRSEGMWSLVRAEPLSMLGDVLGRMDISALGGARLCQTDAVVQEGGTYTFDFGFSSGRWRCLDLIEVPSGTALRFEWSNESDWIQVVECKDDTLSITFEVEEVREISYTHVIPDMPERWMRLYVCRILDIAML